MTLRAIDIAAMRPPETVSAGAVPELRWLDIDALRIDDSYQRPLGRGNILAIERIAAAFQWSMFTPVVVAPLVEGSYALIDGQHRTHAARLAGFDQVPAMVVIAPEAGQAAAFAAINGTTIKISPINLYRAALVARIPWALRCEAAVAAAGCRLLTVNQSAKHRKVRDLVCIGMIRDHIAKDRDALVTAVLAAIAAQPGVTREHFAEAILTPFLVALVAILSHQPRQDEIGPDEPGPAPAAPDLLAFCAAHDLVRLRGRIQQMSGRPEHDGTSVRQMMTTTIGGLLKAHLPPAPVAVPDAPAPRISEIGRIPDEAALGAAMAREARDATRVRASRRVHP